MVTLFFEHAIVQLDVGMDQFDRAGQHAFFGDAGRHRHADELCDRDLDLDGNAALLKHATHGYGLDGIPGTIVVRRDEAALNQRGRPECENDRGPFQSDNHEPFEFAFLSTSRADFCVLSFVAPPYPGPLPRPLNRFG